MRSLVLGTLVVLTVCKPEAPAAQRTVEEAYLALGDKLAADSIDELDTLAGSLVASAEPRATAPGMDEVLAGAGRVAAQDIATARVAYRKISAGMIKYFVANPQAREGMQLVHCTMTFEGDGGWWVQRAGKVMNPYEGAMMLHCGDVTPWEQAPTA